MHLQLHWKGERRHAGCVWMGKDPFKLFLVGILNPQLGTVAALYLMSKGTVAADVKLIITP